MLRTGVDAHVRAEIARRGPVPFAEVVAAALYLPDAGFYATEGQAGRRGDFLTSPEVGPLFGAVIAGALDRWWVEAGSPAVFVVVEQGAGPGTLAAAVLHAQPRCAEALRYVLVEGSPRQRAAQAERLSLEYPAAAFATLPEPDDDAPSVAAPPGPIVVSLGEPPRLPGPCIVIANELLDNLPFRLAERTRGGWAEVHVGLAADDLAEVALPLASGDAALLDELAPGAAPGARVPLATEAVRWVRDARALAGPAGRVLAFDYAMPTAGLAERPWTEWVRTYRQHQRGRHPLEGLGTQDITCEVPLDQLPAPALDRSQAEWLRAHGIDDLVTEARRAWEERSAMGDLAAVRARSRVHEAAALLDPTGLGAFRALEWTGTP